MRTARSLASNAVIGPTPELPAIRFCHVVSRSLPRGVTAPNPVMTTRLVVLPYL